MWEQKEKESLLFTWIFARGCFYISLQHPIGTIPGMELLMFKWWRTFQVMFWILWWKESTLWGYKTGCGMLYGGIWQLNQHIWGWEKDHRVSLVLQHRKGLSRFGQMAIICAKNFYQRSTLWGTVTLWTELNTKRKEMKRSRRTNWIENGYRTPWKNVFILFQLTHIKTWEHWQIYTQVKELTRMSMSTRLWWLGRSKWQNFAQVFLKVSQRERLSTKVVTMAEGEKTKRRLVVALFNTKLIFSCVLYLLGNKQLDFTTLLYQHPCFMIQVRVGIQNQRQY